jgi:hypothetical protein
MEAYQPSTSDLKPVQYLPVGSSVSNCTQIPTSTSTSVAEPPVVSLSTSPSIKGKKPSGMVHFGSMLGFVSKSGNAKKGLVVASGNNAMPVPPQVQSRVIINIENKVEKTPPAPSNEDNSDMIVKATYTTDLNILKINEAVRSVFAYKYWNLPKMKQQAADIHKNISRPNITINDVNRYKEDYEAIVAEISSIEQDVLWDSYISRASPLLDEYSPLASDETKGIVSVGKMTQVEDEAVVRTRLSLIKQYIDVAKDYIKLDIVNKLGNEATCPGCSKPFDELVIDEDSGMCICRCGYERANLSKSILYKDGSRVNMGNRNNYIEKQNFIKELDYFDSLIGDPPKLLYVQLDTYFTSIGFPIGEYWENQPLTETGEKLGTSLPIMFEALSRIENSAYFNSINLIVHKYWGWALISLNEYRDKIMGVYNDTKRIYNALPASVKEYRTASLNAKFTLLGIVRALNIPIKTERIKIQETRDSLVLHNKLWKICCDKVDKNLWKPVI